MQLIGLWQKALVKFKSSQITDLVASKWLILLDKDLAHIAKANINKQIWDLRDSYHALLYTLPMGMTVYNLSDLIQSYSEKTCYISRNLVFYVRAYCAVICFDTEVAKETVICFTPVFKGVNLVWAGLSSLKCAVCDKRCLVFIYAKKQAPVFHPVFFGGVTWASVISGFPTNLYSILLIENNLSIDSVDSLMPMADILCKLNRLLAVLLASFTVSLTSKHNLVLDMAVNAPLFISSVPNVVTAVSQNISSSGFCVLTAKVGGLKANLAVLGNSVKMILNKLDSFGSGSGIVTPSLSQ
ncbi:hypothetical protein G9A89_012970 [Geosiphon pyriformis]|nr:hypothetical protein G9A89_012970 [Geosiphon pyriformis]